jgi:hypothetical protein
LIAERSLEPDIPWIDADPDWLRKAVERGRAQQQASGLGPLDPAEQVGRVTLAELGLVPLAGPRLPLPERRA